MTFWGADGPFAYRLRLVYGHPMTTVKITVPPGFTVAELNDNTFYVSATGERLTHTVAFRLPPSEYLALLPFFESFPDSKGSVALRWLICQPEVQAVIERQTQRATLRRE